MTEAIEQLHQVGKDFETIMLHRMIKKMRSTVPTNKLFGNNFANGTFRELLDAEIAKQVSSQSDLGIAESIVKSYKGLLEGGRNEE